ncbi:hypothetical protein J6590_029619 [Homalodisca vitripennis]|nr:hypothetical protein J6590_029619 [Homalodisca vitripennis]
MLIARSPRPCPVITSDRQTWLISLRGEGVGEMFDNSGRSRHVFPAIMLILQDSIKRYRAGCRTGRERSRYGGGNGRIDQTYLIAAKYRESCYATVTKTEPVDVSLATPSSLAPSIPTYTPSPPTRSVRGEKTCGEKEQTPELGLSQLLADTIPVEQKGAETEMKEIRKREGEAVSQLRKSVRLIRGTSPTDKYPAISASYCRGGAIGQMFPTGDKLIHPPAILPDRIRHVIMVCHNLIWPPGTPCRTAQAARSLRVTHSGANCTDVRREDRVMATHFMVEVGECSHTHVGGCLSNCTLYLDPAMDNCARRRNHPRFIGSAPAGFAV